MYHLGVMDTFGLRELRQHASDPVRRAEAGDHLVITVSGRPAAVLLRRRRPFRRAGVSGAVPAVRRRAVRWPRRCHGALLVVLGCVDRSRLGGAGVRGTFVPPGGN
ncbi:type II toxin-antitoxin system Phd/YefM family antitoxin [Kribbella sp. NPDC054772]